MADVIRKNDDSSLIIATQEIGGEEFQQVVLAHPSTGVPLTVPLPVAVNNFPAEQTVTGGVTIENFPAEQAVTGSVAIENFPAEQAISGTVGVNNFPAEQAVTGSVTILNSVLTVVSDGLEAVKALLEILARPNALLFIPSAKEGFTLGNAPGILCCDNLLESFLRRHSVTSKRFH